MVKKNLLWGLGVLVVLIVFCSDTYGSRSLVLSYKKPIIFSDFDVYIWEYPGKKPPYLWKGAPVPKLFLLACKNNNVKFGKRNDWQAHDGYLYAPNTGKYYIIWKIKVLDKGKLFVDIPFQYYADKKRSSRAYLEISFDGNQWKQVSQIGKVASRESWYNDRLFTSLIVKPKTTLYIKVIFQDHGIWTPPKLKMKGLKITLVPISNRDRDGDGLNDKIEWKEVGSSYEKIDTDGDGLTDFEEVMIANSRPNRIDTDGDGLTDYEEFGFGSNPNRQDTDGDGLTDFEEYFLGSNPLSDDTDGDGLKDEEEFGISDPIYYDADRDGQPDPVDEDLIEIKDKLKRFVMPDELPANQLRGIHAEGLMNVDNEKVSLQDFVEYLRCFKMNFVLVGLWNYTNVARLNHIMSVFEKNNIKVAMLAMRVNRNWKVLVPALMKYSNFVGIMLDEPVNIEKFYSWADTINKIAGKKIAMVNFSPTLCELYLEDWRGEVEKARKSGRFSQIWLDPYGPRFFVKVLFYPSVDGILPYVYIGPRARRGFRFTREHTLYLNELYAKLCIISGKHFAYYNIGRFVSFPEGVGRFSRYGHGPWQPSIEKILSVFNPQGRIPEKFRQKPFQINWLYRTFPIYNPNTWRSLK